MSKRICIWGASTVWGAGDQEIGGWVNRLKLYYVNKEPYEWAVYNVGISNDTTEELLKRFDVEAVARNPEIIILTLGINDTQYWKKEDKVRVPIDQASKNIALLIDKAQKYVSRVIVIGPYPIDDSQTTPISWETNVYFTNERAKQYNQEIEKVCQQKKVPYVNLYQIFSEQEDYKSLLSDGLHPNEEGHQLIFEIIKKELNL